MIPAELNAYLAAEIAAFPGKTSLLVADLPPGAVRHAWQPEEPVPSASTIKVPILLAALEEVRLGRSPGAAGGAPPPRLCCPTPRCLTGETDCSPVGASPWMTALSDNTATNVILDLLGLDAVNRYATRVLGLQHTVCRRKMLDAAAAAAGRDNRTSAADQCRLYRQLCLGRLLTPRLTGDRPGSAPPSAVHGRRPALSPPTRWTSPTRPASWTA